MIIKKNKIDIASELERILLQANEPLRLDILFSRLKETFPEIKYEYPSQIKIYIQKSHGDLFFEYSILPHQAPH